MARPCRARYVCEFIYSEKQAQEMDSRAGIAASWSWTPDAPPCCVSLSHSKQWASPAGVVTEDTWKWGAPGEALNKHHVSKRFSGKPSSVLKSLRRGLARPSFLEAAPNQPGFQNREALGIAQLGSQVTAEGDTGRPHSDH